VSFNPALGRIFTNVMNAGQWGHVEARQPGQGRGGGRGGSGGRGGRGGGRGGPPPEGAAGASGPAGPSFGKVTPEGGRFWQPNMRYSCAPPPWGELVAVKANTGDIAWRAPLGEFEALA